MSEKKPPALPIMERIRKAIPLRDNQSALYQWFLRHYDEFVVIAEGTSRPSWSNITAEFNAEGIRKPDGSEITPDYASRVWWKVRKSKRGQQSPRHPDIAPPASLPHKPAPPALDEDDDFVLQPADGSPPKPKGRA